MNKDTQALIDLLWDEASDAYSSILTKKELDDEGYECPTEFGRIVTFVFPVED